MSTGNLWKLGAIVTPAGTIGQITQRTINPGVEHVLLRGDGRVDPHYVAVMSQAPMFSFTTTAIAAALTALGGTFYAFSTATDFYLTKMIAGGGVGGSSTHGKLSLAKGCIIARVIEGSHGQPATLQCDAYGISADGTTNPLSYTGSVSLPAAITAEAFTLGPATINNTSVGAIDRLRIEFGYAEKIQAGDGEVYPTFGCYLTRTMKIGLGGKDVAQLASGAIAVGGAVIGSATKFFLRKLTEGGTRVADATTVHLKFTVTEGRVHVPSVDESDENESGIDIEVQPTFDGTNDPVAIGNGVAIA